MLDIGQHELDPGGLPDQTQTCWGATYQLPFLGKGGWKIQRKTKIICLCGSIPGPGHTMIQKGGMASALPGRLGGSGGMHEARATGRQRAGNKQGLGSISGQEKAAAKRR